MTSTLKTKTNHKEILLTITPPLGFENERYANDNFVYVVIVGNDSISLQIKNKEKRHY